MQIVLKSIEQKKNHNSTWRYTREIQITESSSGRNKNQEIADEFYVSRVFISKGGFLSQNIKDFKVIFNLWLFLIYFLVNIKFSPF